MGLFDKLKSRCTKHSGSFLLLVMFFLHRGLFLPGRAYTFPERKVTAMVREETMIPAAAHVLHMENREKLTLAGVEDVSGFDENLILLETSLGALHVRGEQLHIERIDLEAGQLELRGRIRELSYDEPARSASLWARLFG